MTEEEVADIQRADLRALADRLKAGAPLSALDAALAAGIVRHFADNIKVKKRRGNPTFVPKVNPFDVALLVWGARHRTSSDRDAIKSVVDFLWQHRGIDIDENSVAEIYEKHGPAIRG